MKNVGTQPITTDRLTLRRFTAADAPEAYVHWQSDPEVTKYLTWPAYTDPAAAAARMQWTASQYSDPAFYQWAIQLNDAEATLVGNISVVEANDAARWQAIGYVLGRAWWGHGYMPEALRAVIDYLFTNTDVNRIEATHDVQNPNSGKVMAKAGMHKEGVLRARGKNNTGIVDEAFYALLRDEWTKKAGR